MKSLLNDVHGIVDLGIIMMIGISFAGLMVISFIMYTLVDQLGATGAAANTMGNISAGFDNAIGLILVAITVFILAIAISALLLLRGQ